MRGSGYPEWDTDITFLEGQRQVSQIRVMMEYDTFDWKEKKSNVTKVALSIRRKIFIVPNEKAALSRTPVPVNTTGIENV